MAEPGTERVREIVARRVDTAPSAATAADALLGGELNRARVLALQRAAGNRATGRVIARRDRAPGVRVLARDKSLDDQVFDLTQAIGAASPVTDALKQQAQALARKCWAAGASGSVDDARRQVKSIVGALMFKDAQDTGIDIAKGADAEVQRSALMALGVNTVSRQENFITKGGRLAGVTIAGPTASQNTAQWLDANTDKIGQVFKKLQDMGISGLKGGDLSLELAGQVLSGFFRAATDAEGDIKPDPMGKTDKLTVDPGTSQIVADCDVWATYGARLFRAMGWTTVAYLSVIPDEQKPSDPTQARDGHAVVLVKLDDGHGNVTFAGISDFMIQKFTSTTEMAARDELLAQALQIYDPPSQKWKSYYLAAGLGGKYDVKILDPAKNSLTPWKTQP